MFSDIAILVLLVLLLYHFALTSAKLVNVTVDDTFGDPLTGAQFIYSPSDEWIAGDSSKYCSGCLSFIDRAYVHNGTWHNTFYDPGEDDTLQSASISFNGSALYVYCVLVYNVSAPGSNPSMTFMVDDQVVGSFDTPPISDSEDVISYDYLVYANETLSSETHTFTLVNWASKNSTPLAVLDYIKYSTDSLSQLRSPAYTIGTLGPTPSVDNPPAATITVYLSDPNSQTRAIIIAVSIVGVTLLLALGAFAVFWRRYVRANASSKASSHRPSSVHGAESRRSDPWMEGTWVNQQYSRRPFHKSQSSVEQALLSAHEDLKGAQMRNVSASLIIHTVASRREQPQTEEYDPVVLQANSNAPPTSLRGSITAVNDMSMSEHLPRHPAVLRRPLVVTIPGRVSSAEPALPSSSSIQPPPPPKSPRRKLKSALRPRSEPASTSPPSAGSSRTRSIPMRTTTPSTGTRGSTGFGGDRTTINSMSTPTSVDFCFQNPSVRYLPARADSVKTIKLSPHRYPDVFAALPPARTVPLEGASSDTGSTPVGDGQRKRSDMESRGQQKDLPPLVDGFTDSY